MKIYRAIDANLNRVSEGLRILEDLNRFIFDDAEMSSEFRRLRHAVRKSFTSDRLLISRQADSDVGLATSKASRLDKKSDLDSLIISNFKRVEEGLRVVEEGLKILDYYDESKIYEDLRFQVYDLEKKHFNRRRVLNSDIYGILGEEFSRGRTNPDVVRELAAAGVKIIQYREKNKTKSEKYKECSLIRKITREEGIFFIVNDDLDIALAVDADGLHIGQDDLDLELVKKAAPNLIVGLSTHNREEALAAVEGGVDYIGVGPIFPTSTKENLEESEGLDYLEWVSKNIDLPYVAIGGIGEDNIAEVQKKGGYCFAMISELVSAEDIGEKVTRIRRILGEE